MTNLRYRAIGLGRRLLRKSAPEGVVRAGALWLARRTERRAGKRAERQREQAAGALRDQQRAFDRRFPTTDDDVRRAAGESTLIVFESAPFTRLCALVAALSAETIQPGELLVVDTTAETVAGASVSVPLARWKFQIPLVALTIVPYDRQDVRFAHAMALATRVAKGRYWWFAGERLLPAPRTFEYLLKACIAAPEPTVIAAWTGSDDAMLHAAHARPDIAAAPASVPLRRLAALSPIEALEGCAQGLFGAPRALLAPGGDDVFDPLFLTETGAIADLAARVRRSGARIATSASLLAFREAGASGGDEPWQTLHDARHLESKAAPAARFDTPRIEIVCPFHRGDVVLAIQVAAHLRTLGRPVRLHVQRGMTSWVRDIAPELDVEAVAVDMPPAERTYPELLKAYRLVVERDDVSPWIARAHPQRSLSLTGRNLLDYLFEQVGLPADTVLENARPRPDAADRDHARRFFETYDRPVVFVHPFGGWHLKTLPPVMLAELVRRLHAAGLQVVQMGGRDDARSDAVDAALLENFLPSRWAAMLELAGGFIGVDSWTAHFASILDMPQITCFGSTHPMHVRTKSYFASQRQPAFAFGPIVNCSPCNSLTCLAFPGAAYCAGYAIDDAQFERFVALARARANVSG